VLQKEAQETMELLAALPDISAQLFPEFTPQPQT